MSDGLRVGEAAAVVGDTVAATTSRVDPNVMVARPLRAVLSRPQVQS